MQKNLLGQSIEVKSIHKVMFTVSSDGVILRKQHFTPVVLNTLMSILAVITASFLRALSWQVLGCSLLQPLLCPISMTLPHCLTKTEFLMGFWRFSCFRPPPWLPPTQMLAAHWLGFPSWC